MNRNKSDLLSNTKDVKNSKFVARNTLTVEYNNGTKAIRFHDTDILTFKGSEVSVNTGGWLTSTTKERINRFSDLRVWQENSLWYINGHTFYDGITFDLQGNLISKDIGDRNSEVNKLKKRIAKYVKLVTKDNLPIPDGGDCWLCYLVSEDGKTMGDNDHSHLESHLDESYLHGSILVNAMREYGYTDEQIGLHYSMKLHMTFQRALRKYLQRRLIKTIAV